MFYNKQTQKAAWLYPLTNKDYQIINEFTSCCNEIWDIHVLLSKSKVTTNFCFDDCKLKNKKFKNINKLQDKR